MDIVVNLNTAWKVSMFGVFLVRIFPHSDWIRKVLQIFPYSLRIRENTDKKNSEYEHFLSFEMLLWLSILQYCTSCWYDNWFLIWFVLALMVSSLVFWNYRFYTAFPFVCLVLNNAGSLFALLHPFSMCQALLERKYKTTARSTLVTLLIRKKNTYLHETKKLSN